MLRYGLYSLGLIGLLTAAVFSYFFLYRYPYWNARAFVVPSGSMCPTVCKHERLIALLDPDKQFVPHRDDVIVMDHQSGAKFIKRVVGLPGDVITPGPRNEILINGKVWMPPPVCGTPGYKVEAEPGVGGGIPFTETKVPPGSYFVIGDNLPNSLDSRTKEFGLVSLNEIEGQAMILYFSPRLSRIGCKIC
jgi:signal peptidase I